MDDQGLEQRTGEPPAPDSSVPHPLLRAVASVAQLFLRGQDWDATVAKALELLGTAIGVHRVYVFRNHESDTGTLLVSQYAEWTAPGVPPQIDNPELQDASFEEAGFGRWLDVLARDDVVAGPVESLPPRERRLLDPQGIRSLVVAPVFVGSTWWGFIGFDDVESPRTWSAGELEALRTAAGAFGHAVGRRAMEAALVESERRYRMILDAGNDAIYLFGIRDDGDATTFLEVNAAATELLGYSRAELLEMTPYELSASDDRVDLSSIPEDGSFVIERVHVGRDGTEIPVEISARRAELDGRAVIVAVARDVRDRKRAEAELLAREAELRQAQKMEAVGRLAGGVAHDFNNLLTGIQGAADLALAETDAGAAVREDLEEIVRTAHRGARLTKQLLAFSRQDPVEPAVRDVNEVVGEVDRMLRRLIGEDIELSTSLAGETVPVRLGTGQLEQVIMNLAVNARDAMPGGGLLRITTSAEDDRVRLTVEDQGVGMDAATRARVFEPFFTTKEAARGTGLGLSTVYGIVTGAGGDIELESEVGRGTRVTLTLPRVDAPDPTTEPGRPADRKRADPAAPRKAAILLVEDETNVRRLIERVLTRDGHTVRGAGSAGEALELLDGFEPDLLLSDVVLPGSGGGPSLADEARRRVPDIAVVLMSGYTEQEVRTAHGAASTRFLPKPFTPADLRAVVADVLA